MHRQRSLRILHVLRAPVGGLFRHVSDLAREQAARGHAVGVIADSATGDETAHRQLEALAPWLQLGVRRFPMRREPHIGDLSAMASVFRETLRLRPDIVHGHGSKGGLYTRALSFLPGVRAARVYTPHGGSFHRQHGHDFYVAVERLVVSRTDLLLFESDFIARAVAESLGPTGALQRVAKNGLRPEEFSAVEAEPNAADFLYVGELSAYKGVDILIEAMAAIHAAGNFAPRLAIVGSGAEQDKLAALIARHRLESHIAVLGPLEARKAFCLGRVVVAPSRAESLPYIVMEAITAHKTIIATDVGGVGEIFGPRRDLLIPSNDPAALTQAMIAAMCADKSVTAKEQAFLARHVAENFSLRAMADSVLSAYAEALSRDEPAAARLPESAF
ncbi:MAG: glycosyltransferase family 4 protein [Rhodoblastus sp.]|uniref:glycosyltransferase family 4 protein n=1 Tax=Rhodoblastus sp. TaxID=1962975 RepID=UPI003F95CBC4